jgi:rsbT co-antagonist protein RsbR
MRPYEEQMKEIAELLRKHESEILSQWLTDLSASTRRGDLMSDQDVRNQATQFLKSVTAAVQQGANFDNRAPQWKAVTDLLDEVSRTRAVQGFSPSETATFVFTVKKPIFALLRKEYSTDARQMADLSWAATELIDRLGLYTTESYQKAREGVIMRQQQDLLELSTPVVKLWDRVLALPLIGTLDSQRTQVVMETLLQQIVQDGAEVAIIDITGVPTVDTLVAQHLLKTVTAARLMGADCIISGIRPSTAQTIVHLGVDLQDVMTKATLADAFRVALRRMGLRVTARKDQDTKKLTNSESAAKD